MNVGDIVRVRDGSWAMEYSNGVLADGWPATDNRKARERWRVLAMDGKFPASQLSSLAPHPQGGNSMMCSLVGNPSHLLFTCPRYCEVVSPRPLTVVDRLDRIEARLGIAQ